MLALILIAASLVSLIAAFIFKPALTEQELEENEKFKALMWLPNGIVMLIAAFYTLKRVGEGPPRLSAFSVLVFVCLILMVAGFVALAWGGASGTLK
jgi:multisubunit Na+/H+ antiporter MnhB subunit